MHNLSEKFIFDCCRMKLSFCSFDIIGGIQPFIFLSFESLNLTVHRGLGQQICNRNQFLYGNGHITTFWCHHRWLQGITWWGHDYSQIRFRFNDIRGIRFCFGSTRLLPGIESWYSICNLICGDVSVHTWNESGLLSLVRAARFRIHGLVTVSCRSAGLSRGWIANEVSRTFSPHKRGGSTPKGSFWV